MKHGQRGTMLAKLAVGAWGSGYLAGCGPAPVYYVGGVFE